MNITYKNKKILKVCTNASTAEKAYGREMLIRSISELVKFRQRIRWK